MTHNKPADNQKGSSMLTGLQVTRRSDQVRDSQVSNSQAADSQMKRTKHTDRYMESSKVTDRQ